jgi:hypothetical protein
MAIGKYLLVTLLILSIILLYLQRDINITVENYISYNGILPKENHIDRINNIIYYNDPIFLEYNVSATNVTKTTVPKTNENVTGTNDQYVLLKIGENIKSLGDKKQALTQVVYLQPKNKPIKGLTPVPYMETLGLKVFPQTDFDKMFNTEFMVVPYSTPVNAQQPYLQINDFISFKEKDGKYLCINPLDLTLELISSSTVPNNGIFRVSNSPQCYVNYIKYGIDSRNQNLDTIKNIVDKMKDELTLKLKARNGNMRSIKELRKRESDLKNSIDKYTNNKSYIENQMNILKGDHQGTLDNIRDKYSTIKLDSTKDFANKILADRNAVDSFYLKEMNAILEKGCTK